MSWSIFQRLWSLVWRRIGFEIISWIGSSKISRFSHSDLDFKDLSPFYSILALNWGFPSSLSKILSNAFSFLSFFDAFLRNKWQKLFGQQLDLFSKWLPKYYSNSHCNAIPRLGESIVSARLVFPIDFKKLRIFHGMFSQALETLYWCVDDRKTYYYLCC
jgi:hypothetical protein